MTQPDPNAQAADGNTTATEDAPWGADENFDPDKAKKLIANLRGENTKLKNREVLTPEQKAALAELEQIKAANATDLERQQQETSRWQTEAETWRKAAVGSKIQALAADSFADPSDAVTALAEKNFLDAGGQIDENAIKTELAGVLQAKPHWAKQTEPSGPRPPAPNLAQGSSANGAASTGPAADFAGALQAALAHG